MQRHHEAVLCLHEICQHTVIEFRCQDLQERDRTQFLPHAEHPCVSKLE